EASAGDSANRPITQTNADGPGAGLGGGLNTTVDPGSGAGLDAATGRSSEDSSQAAANTQSAHENLEALRDQNRRAEETTPEAARHPIGDQNQGR
ncbi:MAG: hypothetical protein M3P24_06555, partial [Gemmatimonadota bacterium]|nr:hypothetical protein [Gemmatimonadota bacterium]